MFSKNLNFLRGLCQEGSWVGGGGGGGREGHQGSSLLPASIRSVLPSPLPGNTHPTPIPNIFKTQLRCDRGVSSLTPSWSHRTGFEVSVNMLPPPGPVTFIFDAWHLVRHWAQAVGPCLLSGRVLSEERFLRCPLGRRCAPAHLLCGIREDLFIALSSDGVGLGHLPNPPRADIPKGGGGHVSGIS